MKILWIVIIIVIMIICSMTYKFNIVEHLTGSDYINFNLSEKPYSTHSPDYIYQWWKGGFDKDKYAGCDQYRCK